MNDTKNVFLTTLGKTKNRRDVGYFVCETATGKPSYTIGISVAEAGIKYLLSQHRIDEVITIGALEDLSAEAELETSFENVKLSGMANLEEMSEYDFLTYRITEYMNQIDFELLDIGEPVSEERKQELKKSLDSFRFRYAKDTGMSETQLIYDNYR